VAGPWWQGQPADGPLPIASKRGHCAPQRGTSSRMRPVTRKAQAIFTLLCVGDEGPEEGGGGTLLVSWRSPSPSGPQHPQCVAPTGPPSPNHGHGQVLLATGVDTGSAWERHPFPGYNAIRQRQQRVLGCDRPCAALVYLKLEVESGGLKSTGQLLCAHTAPQHTHLTAIQHTFDWY
jgi:hypothetical protein